MINVLVVLSLVGAFLFYGAMLFLNFPKPSLTGDNAMGYGLGVVYLSVGFFICSTIVSWGLSRRGDFDWVSNSAAVRTMILIASVLLLSVTFLFSAALKYERWSNEPVWVRWIVDGNGVIWIPLLALIPSILILINSNGFGFPAIAIRLPLIGMFCVTSIFVFGLVIGFLKESTQQQREHLKTLLNENTENREQRFREIEDLAPDQSFVLILASTDRFQDDDIREAALAKIKSRPGWEEELLEILENPKTYTSAYHFLECNQVNDTKRFAISLEQSIQRMATSIKKEVKETNNMQEWSFEWYRPESALRAIDFQFADAGVDFVPAVLKLQSALNDHRPERFEKVKLKVSKIVDSWLKKQPS